jgi:hypothetical protein
MNANTLLLLVCEYNIRAVLLVVEKVTQVIKATMKRTLVDTR